MKLYTSYFYQVRFFKLWQIPLSTALGDPSWFHESKGNDHVFIDKNGVLNGIRSTKLQPGRSCHGLCSGKPCIYSPENCTFLREYRKQIFSIDKDDYIAKLHLFLEKLGTFLDFSNEPEIMLIVHEAPTNPCSERIVLQEFFGCNEWKRA